MRIKGIITGDIIASSLLTIDQRAALLKALQQIMEEIGDKYALSYELFRGDSIQIIVEKPSETLLIGVLLRAGIKGSTPKDHKGSWDIRMSLGIGQAEFSSDHITTSDGEAFRLSGRGLDAMTKDTLTLNTPWSTVDDEFKVSIAFLDDLIRTWTIGQARTTYYSLLQQCSRKDLALQLGQTSQNISRLLIAAREVLVKRLITRFESVIQQQIAS